MESRRVFLFGVLLCVMFAIISETSAGGKGKGKGKWMEKMKKCGDGEVNVQEMFKGKEECKKESKPAEGAEERRRRSPDEDDDEEEKPKKKKGKGKHGKHGHWDMNQAVCHLKKVGMLDADGKFSESGCKTYVDKVYPEQYRTDAFNGIKECADKHSSTFSSDNNSAGYSPFKKCLMGAHMKVCKIEWKGGKGGKGGHKKDEDAAANEE